MEEENKALKRHLEELHGQIDCKDVELKNHRRTITDFEQQLNEARQVCIFYLFNLDLCCFLI